MTVLQAAILGVVQGLTEFLPISSDGHLAVAYHLMGMPPNLSFEVFLHAATLIAMLTYFWSDIVRLSSSLLPAHRERTKDRRLLALIGVATVASTVVVLALYRVIEPLSASMVAVALGFLGTTVLLVVAELADRRVQTHKPPERLGLVQLGVIGLLQGLAALPGLSRSGSTISGGMLFGLSREDAARFGFLLGIPIITLASLESVVAVAIRGWQMPGSPLALAVGFLAAGATGYLAIWGLLKFVKNHSLYWFAAYTGVLGTVMLLNATVFGRG